MRNQYLTTAARAALIIGLGVTGAAVSNMAFAADAPAATPADATTLPEVIVQARRVSENQEHVPVAVTTLNAQALRNDNAVVAIEDGPWGREVVGAGAGVVRFIGVDGFRWMVRCVVTSPNSASNTGNSPVSMASRASLTVSAGCAPQPSGQGTSTWT